MVDDEGRVTVEYTNLASGSMQIPHRSVALLVPVGGFAANFLRSLWLVLVQLMFMAALGVFFGTFLGFAVGVVVTFSVLPFSLFRSFLKEASEMMVDPQTGAGPFAVVSRALNFVMRILLPDLESTSTSTQLADGLMIGWWHLLSTTFWTLVVRSLLLVLLACWIWRNRELSRVQV